MATDFSQINLKTLGSQPFTNVFTGKQENMPSTKAPATSTKTGSKLFGSGVQPITANQSTINALKGTSVGNSNVSNDDYISLITGTTKPKEPVPTILPADTATKVTTTVTPPTVPAVPYNKTNIAPAVESTLAKADSTVTTPTETTAQKDSSSRSLVDKYLTGQLTRDTKSEREQLRKEADLIAKEETSRKLKEDLRAKKTYYERQIEELEKNPEGKLMGQVRADIERLSQKANRELADISVQYEVANNDYVAAQNIVNERIKDMQAEDARLNTVVNTMINFVQDDMTESEKLQVQNALQIDRDEKDFSRQKELLNYKAMLDNQYTDTGLVTLSPEDNARFNSTPEAEAIKKANNFKSAVGTYKQAIETYGTGELAGYGAGVLGKAYENLVTTTQKYYGLGSYDNGVEKLTSMGIKKPSVLGLKSTRMGSLDTAEKMLNETIANNAKQLLSTKFANSAELQQLLENSGYVAGSDPLGFGVNANPLNLDL